MQITLKYELEVVIEVLNSDDQSVILDKGDILDIINEITDEFVVINNPMGGWWENELDVYINAYGIPNSPNVTINGIDVGNFEQYKNNN